MAGGYLRSNYRKTTSQSLIDVAFGGSTACASGYIFVSAETMYIFQTDLTYWLLELSCMGVTSGSIDAL